MFIYAGTILQDDIYNVPLMERDGKIRQTRELAVKTNLGPVDGGEERVDENGRRRRRATWSAMGGTVVGQHVAEGQQPEPGHPVVTSRPHHIDISHTASFSSSSELPVMAKHRRVQ